MNILFKKMFSIFQLALIGLVSLSAIQAQSGAVDPTFNAAVQETAQGSVQAIVAQPDGKILVGGNFTVANNTARTGIARFNADGSVDPAFDPPDFYSTSFGAYTISTSSILAVAVQADGKILVGGIFIQVNNQLRTGMVRLNADGSLDSTFAASLPSGNGVVVREIRIQSDNRILIAGDGITGNQTIRLLRLNADGSFDPSFQGVAQRVSAFVVQPDGKIVIGNSDGTGISRLNSDGTQDFTFTPVQVGSVLELALQADGKILVGGSFTTVNSFTQNNISRINANGSLDTTFNPNGGTNSSVNGIAVLPDGKIVIGGAFTIVNGTTRLKNARLNSDGTLDASYSYNPGGSSIILVVTSLGDGRVILGGSDGGGVWDKLARINADGSLDATFTGAIYQRGIVNRVLSQPDGKVLIVGSFRKINGVARQNIARLNADGSVDAGFTANANNVGYTVALQSDGKIIVSGLFTALNGASIRPYLTRLNSDGTVDTSFQQTVYNPSLPAFIDEVAVLPDGKIIVTGNLFIMGVRVNVTRLNPNGTEDTSFTRVIITAPFVSNTDIGIYALKIQPDGKIVIGGIFTELNGVTRGRIARLNANGTLDTTFNPPFGANNIVYDLAIQSDGKIVIGGLFSGVNGFNNIYYLARLFPDGAFDSSFVPTPNATVYAVERQADDKILIGGLFNTVGGIQRYNLARINSNGTLDNSFAGTGANDIVRNIYAQPNGNILVGGEFTRINRISRVGAARLINAPAAARTPYDFDGDGKADLSVFRPSNGVWYQLNSTTNQQAGQQFGANGDVIAPADFDGDGRTDLAVYRSGNWFIQRSSQGFTGVAFGAPDDLPVPADYDGDGRADIAVWRPSNGTWYRINSSNGQIVTVQFGQLGDKPTLGDFDANGLSDIAVFRPSNGVWYRIDAANQQLGTQFGANGDLVVPADYDGDGKTDIAVWRPSNGTWYLLRSSLGFTGVQFGEATDKPTPADYDGDGKSDIAVYRPSNGVWYLLRSTQGFTGTQFGISEDAPIPNAFVR